MIKIENQSWPAHVQEEGWRSDPWWFKSPTDIASSPSSSSSIVSSSASSDEIESESFSGSISSGEFEQSADDASIKNDLINSADPNADFSDKSSASSPQDVPKDAAYAELVHEGHAGSDALSNLISFQPPILNHAPLPPESDQATTHCPLSARPINPLEFTSLLA